jgi:hypothetical protein
MKAGSKSRPSQMRKKKSCWKLLRRRPVIEVVNPTGQHDTSFPPWHGQGFFRVFRGFGRGIES